MDDDDDEPLTELEFSDDEEYNQLKEKLANERERLQRPDSADSDDDSQLKLQQAMLRRQELLDRIRQEQILDDQRPRTYSPRRRYTPSPLPPPSRRSLPDLNRAYHFNWYNKEARDMAQTKHIIEHQFRPADPAPTQRYTILPAIQQQPQVTTIQAPQPIIQQLPAVQFMDTSGKTKDTMFNKSDFMDMMMLQNAQMHHMVMQQMMLQNLPGGGGGSYRLPTAQVPLAPVMAEPMVRAAPMVSYAAPAPVVHHYQSMPPLDIRGPMTGGGRGYYGDYYGNGFY